MLTIVNINVEGRGATSENRQAVDHPRNADGCFNYGYSNTICSNRIGI